MSSNYKLDNNRDIASKDSPAAEQDMPPRVSNQPTPQELRYMLGIQRQLLAKIANCDSLNSITNTLCESIEKMCTDSYAFTLVGNKQDCKYAIYTTGKIPRELYPQFQVSTGLADTAVNCSYVSAIKIAQPVFSTDVYSDPDWSEHFELSRSLTIGSCWSYPLFGHTNTAIGSISILHKHKGYPSPFMAQLLETAAYILGVAITSAQSRDKLAKTKAHLHNITRSLPVAIVQLKLVDRKPPSISYFNQGLLNVFDYPLGYKDDFQLFWHQLNDVTRRRLLRSFLKNNISRSSYNQEFYLTNEQGEKKWFYLSASIEDKNDIQPLSEPETCLNCMLFETTKERRDREKIDLACMAFNSTDEGILITDSEHNIVDLNAAYRRISGYSRSDLIGKNSSEICPWQRKISLATLAEQGHWQGEVASRRKNGESFFQRVTINAVSSQDHHNKHFVYVAADLSQLKDSEAKLLFMQQHDPLTELPNRLLFKSLLEYEIKHCDKDQLVAILMLDLNRFKHVNESLGHRAGDQLLKLVARRLNNTLDNQYTIARIGGDEFAILLTDMSDKNSVIVIAEQIIRAMELPFSLENYNFYTTGTIGISLYPEHSSDSEILIKNADAAVHQGKDSHRNSYLFYHYKQSQMVESWVRMESALRQALKNNQFRVFFQPQINTVTGAVSGVETLIRWQHPEQGLLTPDKFLHILEAIGLMPEVGAWVIEQACYYLSHWRAKYAVDFKVAVNASSQELIQGNLAGHIAKLLDQYQIPAENLEIEILETVIMEHAGEAVPLLTKLRDMGVSLALDDFGTGNSSLSYLKQLPVQKLKIDRSMVQDIESDDKKNAIVGAIIALGHRLGMSICAEGVESQLQLDFLRREQCEQIQGYMFAKPMIAADFEIWYEQHRKD
ncbi:MAG: EAL domain-containing protein [Pseudomonadales bacterium]|nr:EAL domain-containing protein [Pseudomonadales bacterium]NRA14348.1 EAL domain-containing protein [Oceanospirillaceae bacterium]